MTSFIDAIENAAYQKALKNLKIMDKYIYRGKLEGRAIVKNEKTKLDKYLEQDPLSTDAKFSEYL